MNKERKMFSLIKAWEQSGQSQAEFCVAEGVSLASFGYWRTKWLALQSSGEKESVPLFIPIKKEVSQVTGSVGSSYEIIYPNGVRLCLPVLDLSLLPQLLSLHV